MDSTPQNSILDIRRRLASPNERRVIARQDLGHQRRLIIGAIYTSPTHNDILALKHGKQPFFSALRFCIEAHPLLSTVILNADTEPPEFATPKNLDLDEHLEVLDAGDVEDIAEGQCLEKVLARISDEQFEALDTKPPWKVVLASLPCDKSTGAARLLVLFTNYHSHGDGRSGLAFHDSFHQGLGEYISQNHEKRDVIDTIIEAPTTPLLPPIDEGGRMTLSWSYLLSPLLGTYLPRSVVSFLGLRDSWLSSETNVWRGENTRFDPENHSTGLVLITIDCGIKEKLLQQCRANKTTLTGLLQHLIARSLISPEGGGVTASAFLAGVAIDMRHLFPDRYSAASMMNCVTGYSELVYSPSPQEEETWATNSSSNFWKACRKTSASLKLAASTLHNQPIGLLQYLKAFRPWTASLLGKERDMSFEISNLGSVKQPKDSNSGIGMEKLLFSQPAKASGSLLDLNAVSVEEGPLILSVTWQRGVLGLADGREEDDFVRKVSGKLEALLGEIAANDL
ncbi:hypothetical protein E4T44_01719 [Aureobasidium sp. EXF-8845]|nr:hypothetical protein E4T44_01719 [Aureobasidium sp. EXF-8845]KAI4857407.1 hypothetical protein E4T45_01106 [Aureobasidium sp. EXF-8846]